MSIINDVKPYGAERWVEVLLRSYEHVGFMGMKVVTSEFIPKKRVPRKPMTDDLRAMVEDLIDRGEAEEQFSEHEQALIFSPNVPGNFSV